MHLNRRDRNGRTLYHRLFVTSGPLPTRGAALFTMIMRMNPLETRRYTTQKRKCGRHRECLDSGSMRQNPDSPTTLHVPKRSTCGFVIENPGVLSKFKICRILPKTPPIFMRQVRAGHRWGATFSQIKPTKINLSLFGRQRCPDEHVGFPARAARCLSLSRVPHEPEAT